MTDGELLARFLSSQDDSALAALVRRHAPMVWGVCGRLLHHHDAEDAFQATFLVLVRKAADVPRQAVANWLYGVARQTAVRLRALAAKRGRRETQVLTMPEPTVAEARDADWQPVLDEELSRLPDHYRGVVVLCDLEGLTRREAARQLGIPAGSVASRLARARALLARRLTRRGVVFAGGSVAAVLAAGSASASAPPALVASTIKATSLLAAGRAAGFSAKVAVLTERVLKSMLLTKRKIAVVFLALAFVGGGAGWLTCQTVPAAQEPAGKDEPKQQAATARTDERLPEAPPPRADAKAPPPALEQALRIARDIDTKDIKPEDKIRLLTSIGRAQIRAGDNPGALKTFQVALELVKDVENGIHKAGALGEIGAGQAGAGDVKSARKTLAAIEGLVAKTTDKDVIHNATNASDAIRVGIAGAEARAGDSKTALDSAKEVGNVHVRMVAFWVIARAQAERGDFAAAVATVDQTDSMRRAEMLMEVATTQEKTDKTGAAKSWQRALDALRKLEPSEEDLRELNLRVLLPALAERGHGDAIQRWIAGLRSPTVQVQTLLMLATPPAAPARR
jgi:RNA polymerase sigma factor (sigma-70 family)